MGEFTRAICVLAGIAVVLGKTPMDVCERKPIHTTAVKTPGDNGFKISILGTPTPEKYAPGEIYTVIINGTYPKQELLGFFLETVSRDDGKEHGKFHVVPHDNAIKVAHHCPSTIVTHRSLSLPKHGISVTWVAPPTGSGCVEFRAAVIQFPDIWYKDDGALTKVFCEDSKPPEVPLNDENTQCCACGFAMYKMVFQGLWSRQTHPKGFPTDQHSYLLHWSSIVGATHNSHFQIWSYGQKASKGVKEVCEFGYSNNLETEMKSHSRDIRTVIKTSHMWFNVTGTRRAVFTVNKKNNLLSLITMIGPSPDWCLGVSSLNLCMENCTWADHMEIDLYPWDAGTDSGLTYISRNIKTSPQDNIHRITNTYPSNPQSPFHGRYPVKPMARLFLIKDKEDCSSDGGIAEIEDKSPTTAELVDMMKKKMMMKKKLAMEKCATDPWSDWSDCTALCGIGAMTRHRNLKNRNILPVMCSHVDLVQSKQCVGDSDFCDPNTGMMKKQPPKAGKGTRVKNLRKDFIVEHASEIDRSNFCTLTTWSDWSPCSATCSRGMKERVREFFNKTISMEEMALECGVQLRQMDICNAISCEKAMMMKDFTVICQLPPDLGMCKGSYDYWYYNMKMRKCLPFAYTGCRGNENRFDTMEDCTKRCTKFMAELKNPSNDGMIGNGIDANSEGSKAAMKKKRRMMREQRRRMKDQKRMMRKKKRMMKHKRDKPSGPKVDCMSTEWTDWSPCTVTCGKGFIEKRRMIKLEPQNGGKRCPRKLLRKKMCRLPKCSFHCKLGPWTDWSQCSKTCGASVTQERTRNIMRKPKKGAMTCPPLQERRHCSLPLCPNEIPLSDEQKSKLLMSSLPKPAS